MLEGVTDDASAGAGQAHDWHRPADVCHHRARLEGHSAEGGEASKSPTAIVVGPRAYLSHTARRKTTQAVHKMQDEISVVPLSSYGKSYTPPKLQGRIRAST